MVNVIGLVYWQYDDSKSEEMVERKIKNAPAGQGTVRMLTREEWDAIQEVRPRTPFESKFSRHNARIRTGEPLHMVRHSGKFLITLFEYLLCGQNYYFFVLLMVE